MYRIDINKSALFLIDFKDKSSIIGDKNAQIIYYFGNPHKLMKYIYILEESISPITIIIISKDLTQLKSDFKSLFTTVKAAGGLVLNERNEILFIYKKNWWGIPKGKLKKGEKKKDAAIREVMEETSVKNLQLNKKLGKTRSVKTLKTGERILKTCQWYHMSAPNQPLIPQVEEGIEKALWLDLNSFKALKAKPYHSLQFVLDFLPFVEPSRITPYLSTNKLILH